MSNSLIIGLGGTGGKIIREFRKRYYEEFKSFEPQDNCFIEYLYVDSDEGDLKTNWRTQGVSTGLSNAQKVSTHGMNIQDLYQLEDRPQLNGFISQNEVEIINQKLGNVISEGIGGQRRRLGRMLLASHVMQDEGFVARLNGRVNSLQTRSNQQEVHFHICAGLAGGTGSGSVVDAVAQIRQNYGEKALIHLYLYVPENRTVYSDNIDYYQANGYAALQELNAISVGSYEPVDITGVKNPDTGKTRRVRFKEPLTGTYLFSNVNENGRMLNLSEELPQMVADFLFQKIYVDKDGKNEKLRRAEKFENGDPTDEKDARGKRARSIRNLSFGFRRVIFPETEIKEYIAYKFAERAALQMHFEKWSASGYVISARENATDDITPSLIIKDRDALYLGNKILMRESSLPGTETVQDFHESFNGPSAAYSEDALTMEKDEWLNYYNSKMGEFFKKKFRRMGVVDYFSLQTSESAKYARKIVEKIENILFERWENGTYGSLQLEEYVSLLLKDCDARIAEFSNKMQAYETKLDAMKSDLSDRQEDVTRTGFLANLVGKRQDRFLEYCEEVKAYYLERTRYEATKYAITLLESIKAALQNVERSVVTFSKLLSEVTEQAMSESRFRCAKEDSNDAKTLRIYDKNAVDEICDKAIRTEDSQLTLTRNVRNALVSRLGDTDKKGFESFLTAYGAKEKIENAADAVLDVIFEECIKNAETEIENQSVNDSRLKVSNVNILEKLRQEYDDPSGEKLRAFAHELVESAKTFIKKNDSEVTMVSNGNMDKSSTSYIIYLPKENDESGFRDRLSRAFEDAIGDPNKVSISESHRGDQLAIMTLYSMFPMRYVANLTTLKEAYDRLIKTPGSEIHKLVLHTESFAEPLPQLFEATVEEIEKELPKPIMLGLAMGIIREDTDRSTGRTALYLFTKDQYGDSERSNPLGKTFKDLLSHFKLNRKDSVKLTEEVKKSLAADFIHIDNRKALMQKVNEVLRTLILDSCGGDEFGSEYSKYKKIRNEIGSNELNTD